MVRHATGFASALAVCVIAAGGDVSRTNAQAKASSVPGITIGHHTLATRPTGCTVILAGPNGAVGAVDVRGGAPGTVETDLLRPDNTVERVNAIFLSGGSAFGLDVRNGVMKYLAEKKIGYRTGARNVPIVAGAILYDLGIGNPEITPDEDCGYKAATAAKPGAPEEGSVGAGTGATVGKMMGSGRAMKGGLGSVTLVTSEGLYVAAVVAVNAVGSVVDQNNRPVAGIRTADGKSLEDPFAIVRRGLVQPGPARDFENTTIGVVMTNARLTKAQALKVIGMAHDGMARAIVPSHTPSDGDTLFAMATGELQAEPNIGTIGALAAEAVREAIINAVRRAKSLPGYPSASEIR